MESLSRLGFEGCRYPALTSEECCPGRPSQSHRSALFSPIQVQLLNGEGRHDHWPLILLQTSFSKVKPTNHLVRQLHLMGLQSSRCLSKSAVLLGCLVPPVSGVHEEIFRIVVLLCDRVILEHGVQSLQQHLKSRLQTPSEDLELRPKLCSLRRP